MEEKLEKDTHAAEVLDKIGFFDVVPSKKDDSEEDKG